MNDRRSTAFAILRGVAALAAALVVFVFVIWTWASVAQLAYAAGGRPCLRIANHIIMIVLGLGLGAVIVVICSSRDYVTPAMGGVVLFGLGILSIFMVAVDSDDRTDVIYTIVDGMLALLSYILVIGLVAVARQRKRLREPTN